MVCKLAMGGRCSVPQLLLSMRVLQSCPVANCPVPWRRQVLLGVWVVMVTGRVSVQWLVLEMAVAVQLVLGGGCAGERVV
eukprot:4300058-Ditylum_brightwellii.AAC.1